jgi:hypothetical protein
MKRFLAALGFLTFTNTAAAQTPADVLKQMFDALRAQDTVAMKATFHPDMRLILTSSAPDGSPRIQVAALPAWFRGIASAPGSTDERLFDTEVRTDAGLAAIWTRYDFYIGERFSHCGYDAFQLVKYEGQWKVIGGADTQRRDPARCGRGTVPVAETKPTAADTAAVLAPLHQLFAGMEVWDTVAIKNAFTPDARTITFAANGTSTTRPIAMFYQQARPSAKFVERMYNPEVRISDNLATVWTFYDFHIGERFNHCGTDYAQLLRTAEGWKIVQLSWTTRPDNCERVTK